MDGFACEWIIKSDKAECICGKTETAVRLSSARINRACIRVLHDSRYRVVIELTMFFDSEPIILK
jgi:hypothetical protein